MKLNHPVRFITAASLFDGHDAAIHVMRRILQSEGAEVIHLGHNRSVGSVIKAAIEEDVQGMAISSYQGGHVEYFSYMLELLISQDASTINVFGGGGGVIVPEEIELLERRGVKKIYSPKDGLKMGLLGMIEDMLSTCDHYASPPVRALNLKQPSRREIARTITTLELGSDAQKNPDFSAARAELLGAINKARLGQKKAPIVGITGTGGAGKSSLIDELILRFLSSFPDKKIAILSIDPTRIRSGGALLGDRIRLNSADNDRVFARSMATREANISIARNAHDVLAYLSLLDFDVVLLESAGIGQSDSSIKEVVDAAIYVMTPEYGAQSQLEKIDMLDFARLVVINKFDKPGSLDALRDVAKTYQRNHRLFEQSLDTMPVFGTSAHIFGDLGTNRFFNHFVALLRELSPDAWHCDALPEGDPASHPLIPKKRSRYLSQVVESVREHHRHVKDQAEIFDRIDAFELVKKELKDEKNYREIEEKKSSLEAQISPDMAQAVGQFLAEKERYQGKEVSYQVRGQPITANNSFESISHTLIHKVEAPDIKRRGDVARFVGEENLPGFFPFTAGVFPFKRSGEDPTRMFAGEGSPERTNKRFHYLSQGHSATRLSTAFDSVTLYGQDPDVRPDIYGKIGNAGVSVCSLDDAKRLYSGFDLINPKTSVSMTINGPAPTMLAFFFNAAIDFEVEAELKRQGRWEAVKKRIDDWFLSKNIVRPRYRRESLPEGHSGNGLGFLGMPSSLIVEPQFYDNVKAHVLKNIRGTIQADILKEEQAQNTCIYSVDFSLRMMGDCQEYFIKNHIKNFYSVSVSGYHIAEAGANPITQLAFTLANGFTLLEYYRARGMKVDDFAHNFSFFFSNGMDPEYAVIGRVARRIWAIALKNIYGANERSQKLKYHIQTSGRSLHAQEMAFNDIRTTLQALYAITDHCNSLHTNAFDEAITTPTEDSVRRAVAIQMIINHELGLTRNENPLQGSYFIEDLTHKVEDAVLKIFEQLDARGGVLGAMETMYQRSKIQEESLDYQHKKHSGELTLIGVNTFLPKVEESPRIIELMRSSDEEKKIQVEEIKEMKSRFVNERRHALDKLKNAALARENTFDSLMEAAKYSSIGEISESFFEVGGAYRRAM